MDWSPILISMKTASLSIFITFFIGLFAAWAVVSLKNETLKVICDGILDNCLLVPAAYSMSGFVLLFISFRCKNVLLDSFLLNISV